MKLTTAGKEKPMNKTRITAFAAFGLTVTLGLASPAFADKKPVAPANTIEKTADDTVADSEQLAQGRGKPKGRPSHGVMAVDPASEIDVDAGRKRGGPKPRGSSGKTETPPSSIDATPLAESGATEGIRPIGPVHPRPPPNETARTKPKPDKSHGIVSGDPAAEAAAETLRKRGGPKGAGSSDAQGVVETPPSPENAIAAPTDAKPRSPS